MIVMLNIRAWSPARVRWPRWFACFLWALPMVAGAQTSPTYYEVTGQFASARVRESSGIAVSRTQPGVLWTHNDSGDKARVFATDVNGKHLGTFDVRGAKARDWEDIAVGPCIEIQGSCLYIADTGDNNHTRKRVFVYVVPEPTVNREDNQTQQTKRANRLEIRYPDGPQDVEAMAVAPDGGIYLFSKGQRGAIVAYGVRPDQGKGSDGDEFVATVIDTLPIVPQPILGRSVTGAAMDRSGKRVAILTYSEIFFFEVLPTGRFASTGNSCWLGRRQPRGEAIDFMDGDTLILTTEATRGRRGQLALARCSN